jgi:hypothetical protein
VSIKASAVVRYFDRGRDASLDTRHTCAPHNSVKICEICGRNSGIKRPSTIRTLPSTVSPALDVRDLIEAAGLPAIEVSGDQLLNGGSPPTPLPPNNQPATITSSHAN